MARKKPKANKIIYTKVGTKKSPIDKKRALMIFVCVFVSAVVLAGAILGICIAAKNASFTMAYGSIGTNEGVTNYLVSYYKASYITLRKSTGLNITDTEDFWNSTFYKKEDGTPYTFGEDLKNYIALSMQSLLAANKIFDENSKLTAEDKAAIKSSVAEVLEYRAHGSVAQFNVNTEAYGYDYNDFKDATEMLYKARVAQNRICGTGGSALAASSDPEMKAFIEQFAGVYNHVYLTFVRTEDTFVLDENGDRVRDEKNNDKLRPLTEAEKEERKARIATLDACIAGINAGEVAPERFFELMKAYDEGDRSSHEKGYYFYSESKYTQEFASELKEVVESVITLDVGDAVSVKCDFGVCYIYKDAPAKGAYSNTSEDWCFSDFYALAADSFYEELIIEYRLGVVIKDKWADVDVKVIPYNTGDFIARF